METLFGERTKSPSMSRKTSTADVPIQKIVPRILLPWSVIYSSSSKMWVVTLQTNQKALESNNVAEASRSLRAFSLPTERQAVCLAKAWTPPQCKLAK
jgi:hypothetical protein